MEAAHAAAIARALMWGDAVKMRQRVFADGFPARSRLRRLSLRRSALRYATHDWGVLPGACLIGTRFTCGLGCRTIAADRRLAAAGIAVRL